MEHGEKLEQTAGCTPGVKPSAVDPLIEVPNCPRCRHDPRRRRQGAPRPHYAHRRP